MSSANYRLLGSLLSWLGVAGCRFPSEGWVNEGGRMQCSRCRQKCLVQVLRGAVRGRVKKLHAQGDGNLHATREQQQQQQQAASSRRKNPIPSPSCPAQLPRLSLAVRRHHKPPPPAALALLSNTHHPHPPPQPPGATTSRPHAAAAAAAPPRDDSSRPRLSPARAHAFAFASPPQVRSTPQLFFPDLLDTPSAPRVSYRPRPSSTNLVHRSSRTPPSCMRAT
ncbi:hypothetical protein PCL_05738 [Purpureocillium lilacinum]|uniref:Uncharacterized protein n=1 Tax=Purpureocillium lilacinum TaxID=33203 RepID=A0A2U3EKV9_PURLI|nr:hypothetical protein PCL_05738 [Purpureocillium lilacinum]